MPRAIGRPPKTEDDGLPHPAEDLSADDDLLSWILVDQLGAMPNTKLGVHPQQVKFVGPSFKTEETMVIVHETVTKGNITEAMRRLQEFHLIKSHLEGKRTEGQRDRMIQHLRRYLLPLMPTSRVEIHTTDRYSFETGHPELAVYATRPLLPGTVMQELQGSVVPLPDQWRQEMEIGEGFAREAAGEESDSDGGSSSDEDEDDRDGDDGASDGENGDADRETRTGGGDDDDVSGSVPNSRNGREKGKGKERDKDKDGERKARRSDRTKRRDFSIVWSGLKRCFQLFLGPARFLNHDCSPNVELLRQGKYVTFRVIRPIKIGEELTTFYGDNYFGKNNIECLCLTCENNSRGGFTPKEPSRSNSQSRSRAGSTPTPSAHGGSARMSLDRHGHSPAVKGSRPPSSLRNSVRRDDVEAGPSRLRGVSPGHSVQSGSVAGSAVDSSKAPATGSMDTESAHAMEVDEAVAPASVMEDEDVYMVESGSESDTSVEEAPRRERLIRQAVKNAKPIILKRQRKKQVVEEESMLVEDEDLPDDFPRCGTCAKPLMERIWYLGRYFDHCARCTRHALIFGLPWPAKQLKDVQEYPPSHMIPNGYIPRKISRVPLPSLSKVVKRREDESPAVEDLPRSSEPITREVRAGIRLRAEIVAEEFMVQSLREAAWTAQDAREQAIVAAAEAKAEALRRREEAKIRRAEEKAKRNANKIRGSGVWSRYEYISVEEAERREAARNAVTSGTRRGAKYRAVSSGSEGAGARTVEASSSTVPAAAAAALQPQVPPQPAPPRKPNRPSPLKRSEMPKRGRGRPRKIARPGRPRKIRLDEDGNPMEPATPLVVAPKRPRGRPRKNPLPMVLPIGKAKPVRPRPSQTVSPEKDHEDDGESEQSDDYEEDYDDDYYSPGRGKRSKGEDDDESADDESDDFEPSSNDGSVPPEPSRTSPRKRPAHLPPSTMAAARDQEPVPESTLQRVAAYIRACGTQLGRTRAWFVPIPGKDDIAVDIEKTGAFRDVYEQLGRIIPDKNPNTGKPWDVAGTTNASTTDKGKGVASRGGGKDMAPLKPSGGRGSNVRLSPPPQTVNSTAHTSSALPSRNTSHGRISAPRGDPTDAPVSSARDSRRTQGASSSDKADRSRRSGPAGHQSQNETFDNAHVESIEYPVEVHDPSPPRDTATAPRCTVSPDKATIPPLPAPKTGTSKYADLPRFEKRSRPNPADTTPTAADVPPPTAAASEPARPRFPLPAKPAFGAVVLQLVTFPERPQPLPIPIQPKPDSRPPLAAASPLQSVTSPDRPAPLPIRLQPGAQPRPTAAPPPQQQSATFPPPPQARPQPETRPAPAAVPPTHQNPILPRLPAAEMSDVRPPPRDPRLVRPPDTPLTRVPDSPGAALPPKPQTLAPTQVPGPNREPEPSLRDVAPTPGPSVAEKIGAGLRNIKATLDQTRLDQERRIAEQNAARAVEVEKKAARMTVNELRKQGKFVEAEAMFGEHNLDDDGPTVSSRAGAPVAARTSETAGPPKRADAATATAKSQARAPEVECPAAAAAAPTIIPTSRLPASAGSARPEARMGPDPDLSADVSQALNFVVGPYRQEEARGGQIGAAHPRAIHAWGVESSMNGQSPWAVVPQDSVTREIRFPSTTPRSHLPTRDQSASARPAPTALATSMREARRDTPDRRVSARLYESSRLSPSSATALSPLPTFPPAPIPGQGWRDRESTLPSPPPHRSQRSAPVPSVSRPHHGPPAHPQRGHGHSVDERFPTSSRPTDLPLSSYAHDSIGSAGRPPPATASSAASSRSHTSQAKSASPTQPSESVHPSFSGRHEPLMQIPVLRQMSPRSWREKLRVREHRSPESPPPHKRPRQSKPGQHEQARQGAGAAQPQLQVQIHEPPPAWLATPATATAGHPPPPPPPPTTTGTRAAPEVIEILDDDVSDTDSIMWLPPPPGEEVVSRPTPTQPAASASRSAARWARPEDSDGEEDGIQVYEGPLNRPVPSPENQPFSARRYNIRPTSHWSPAKAAGQAGSSGRGGGTPTAGPTPRPGHSREEWSPARDEHATPTARGQAQPAATYRPPLPASVSPTASTWTPTSAAIAIAPISTGVPGGAGPVTPRITNLVLAGSPPQGVFPPPRAIPYS